MIKTKLDNNFPLIVDFDNTLVKTDLFVEHIFKLFFLKIYLFPVFIFKLLYNGRAAAKAYIASIFAKSRLVLPVREEIVDLINNEKKLGREVFLITGSNEDAVRNYIKSINTLTFDEIYGSNNDFNLVGKNKTKFIIENIGEGFIYIGDSKTDLPVWSACSEVIAINPTKSVETKIKKMSKPFFIYRDKNNFFNSLFKLIRIHQWIKNSLIFIPFLLSESVSFDNTFLNLVVGFFVLSILASSTYIINDLIDLDKDRLHWSKKKRPLAAGHISIPIALIVALMSLASSICLSIIFLNFSSIVILLSYYLLTTSYSLFIKRIAILDIVVLSILFTLRIILGVTIISASLPFWLILFSFFIFSSLSIAKRLTELYKLKKIDSKESFGRGYLINDIKFLELFGISFAVSSVVMFSLYILLDAVNKSYESYHFLIFSNLIISVWLMRVWLICMRGKLDDDPIIFALKDDFSKVCGFLVVLFVLISKF